MKTWRNAAMVPVLALAAACSAFGSKGGGPAEPVELVITNNDSGHGLVSSRAMQWFVDRVHELSGDQIAIRAEIGEWATDGREVTAVAAGEADLGWVGTRAFDLLGVDALRPIHAPFLVDSYELETALLTSDIPATMLAALEDIGVAPLAIIGDALRFPAMVDGPLLEPDDWRGAEIWLLESGAYEDAVEALGATAVHGGDPRQMMQDGTLDGTEQMWIYYQPDAIYLYAPYATPNTVLSPRTMALFANPDALADLDQQQRDWLLQAADDTVAWSLEHSEDGDAERIAQVCRYGGRVALASASQLAALRVAAEPLYASLREDPATAAAMAAIEELRESYAEPYTPDIPDGCRYEPGEEDRAEPDPAPLTGPGETGEFPSGTYRYELGPDQVVQAGGLDSLANAAHYGVFTWEMGDGEYTVSLASDAPGVEPITCSGWYAVEGNTATFTYDLQQPGPLRHCLPQVWVVDWAPGDGRVIWGPPSLPVLEPYFSLPTWERID